MCWRVVLTENSALQAVAPTHPFLIELEQKSDLFDRAAAKYTPKVVAA